MIMMPRAQQELVNGKSASCTPSTVAAQGTAQVGIVIPVLNERAQLPDTLARLADAGADRVLVVDGGSEDGTWEWLERAAARGAYTALRSARGRARQMNAGAGACSCEILLFLHADTILPDGATSLIRRMLDSNPLGWGRFDVSFAGNSPAMAVIAWFMNRRSALTGICTGDQAMFMTRDAFTRAGGFPEIPLMEDISLSSRLRRLTPPGRVRVPVVTSARRWQQGGIVATVLRMWWLRWLYWWGVPPDRLARYYHQTR